MLTEAGPIAPRPRPVALRLWLAGPGARRHFDAARQSVADRRRWTSIVSAARRHEWMTSRALLAAHAPAAGAACSLSHSGGYAALMVAPAGMRIGVDIERVKQRDFIALARFGFDPRETAALARLPSRTRARNFYLLWTLKEAAAKALNIDLWRAMRECIFVADSSGWQGRLPTRSLWRACVYAPRRDLVLAAVCVGRGLQQARSPSCREWPAAAQRPGGWQRLARFTG